jgi:excisionase family DNA binding protein
MSLWRWEHDPDLDFPQPTIINGRKYYAEGELEAWERSRGARSSAACPTIETHASPGLRGGPSSSMGTSVPELMHTVQTVAERLGMAERTVRRWITTGELKAFRLGSQLRIAEDDLRAFLDAQREQ